MAVRLPGGKAGQLRPSHPAPSSAVTFSAPARRTQSELPSKDSKRSRAARQAANKRRIEKNKEARHKASILSRAGILPKGAAQLVSIPKGGRAAMTPEQRTLRRKTMSKAAFRLVEGLDKPAEKRSVIRKTTRDKAMAASERGYTVTKLADGKWGVMTKKSETLTKRGTVAPTFGKRTKSMEYHVTAESLVETEDGDPPPLYTWLAKRFAKLKPDEAMGFVWAENDGFVSTIVDFGDEDAMFDYITQSSRYAQSINDKGLTLILVTTKRLYELRAASEQFKKEHPRKRGKRKSTLELTDRELYSRRQYEKIKKRKYRAKKRKS